MLEITTWIEEEIGWNYQNDVEEGLAKSLEIVTAKR